MVVVGAAHAGPDSVESIAAHIDAVDLGESLGTRAAHPTASAAHRQAVDDEHASARSSPVTGGCHGPPLGACST